MAVAILSIGSTSVLTSCYNEEDYRNFTHFDYTHYEKSF